MNPAVPDDLRGVWVRTMLQQDGEGASRQEDDSSWVRWLQTSLWHADLRVPASALADRQSRPLHELTPRQLAALADQQGFAGITHIEQLPEGQVGTWLRRLDYQPPGLQADAGWLVFTQADHLIEVGVHEDYTEVWERLPDSVGRFAALAELAPDGRDTGARALLAGCYFMLVQPRRVRWPRGMNPGYTLKDVLLHSPAQAQDWLDCEVSFGRLQDGHWHVQRSTLPVREGQVLRCALRCLDAHTAHMTLGHKTASWQVLEWSLPGEELAC